MNEFVKALVSNKKSDIIPEEQNLFSVVVGEWDLEWHDHLDSEKERVVKGEWIFSWVLEGTAVQDTFIVPSRAEKELNPQPDAAYGTTIRFYNPGTKSWDVFFGRTGLVVRLNARKEGDEIVLTEITNGKTKWIFSDIKENSFRWREMTADDGMNWKMTEWTIATRKK